MADTPKPTEIAELDHYRPLFEQGWLNKTSEIKPGIFCWGAKPKNTNAVGMPFAKEWKPTDED